MPGTGVGNAYPCAAGINRRAAPPGYRPGGLQAGRERDAFRCDERPADLQLDLRMGVQRNVTWIGLVPLPVINGDYRPGGRAHPVRAQGLAPHVEEIAQGEGAVNRGLDVDDAVRGMGVQPVEAA